MLKHITLLVMFLICFASVTHAANIIQNPGFESGSSNWTEYSSGGYSNTLNDPGNGNGGSNYYALLGGYNSATDSIYQDIVIPASAISATLDFYYSIGTNETTTSYLYDKMTVRIYDPPTSTTPVTITTLSNLNNTSSVWNHSSSRPLSPPLTSAAARTTACRPRRSGNTPAAAVAKARNTAAAAMSMPLHGMQGVAPIRLD